MEQSEILKKRENEKETVRFMIGVYCRGRHRTKKDELCEECAELYNYAQARISHCPYMETKTFCSRCKTHCYKPEMRAKIREVMKYAGPRMLFYDPEKAIRHLIEEIKAK